MNDMHNQNKILRVLQLIALLKKEPSKSIRYLAGVLESTDRTVYRYLDLVKELGFELQKDPNNKFSIVGKNDYELISFSNEEASLLRDLVLTAGKESKLRDSLLQKIYLQSELSIQGNHVLKANLSRIVEKINQAIREKKRIVLKDYHSINSQKISDRIIEPIGFTEHYHAVCAYEIDSKSNKYFNVERITAAVLLDEPQTFEEFHERDEMDVFGFSAKNGEKYTVELAISLKAFVLMKEEYPKIAHCVKSVINAEVYHLRVDVNNPKPIVRFVLGLLDDIEIIGSLAFKEYVKNYVMTTLENSKNKF